MTSIISLLYIEHNSLCVGLNTPSCLIEFVVLHDNTCPCKIHLTSICDLQPIPEGVKECVTFVCVLTQLTHFICFHKAVCKVKPHSFQE